MASEGHFELSQHQMPDGAVNALPTYLGQTGETLPETDGLLDAVKLIDQTLGVEGYFTLDQLAEEVGKIVVGKESAGLVFEDHENQSTLKITKLETTVSVRAKGVTNLPTDLIFDALHEWSVLSKSGDASS